MNIEQHLLTKLSEECAEIQQKTSKASIFGRDSVAPSAPEAGDNEHCLNLEFNDLIGITELLAEECGYRISPNRELINAKKEKVKHYMKISQNLGFTES